MQYTTNLNLKKPEGADQYNVADWNSNSDIIDSEIAGLKGITDATFKTALLNFCYPIGSLYWSSKSTSPATLFGGTWTQIKDKFVWAKGDNDTVNATGGEKTHTLTVTEIPSHSHSFTPSGTVSSHSHSFTPSGTVSSHSHKLNNGNTSSSGTVTTAGFRGIEVTSGANNRSHKHDVSLPNLVNPSNSGTDMYTQGGTTYYTAYKAQTLTSSDESQNHTHKVTASGYLYGSTDNAQPTFTGTAGTTDNAQPTFTGTAGTTGTKGSGTAHNNMPPYIVKYCWERTA